MANYNQAPRTGNGLRWSDLAWGVGLVAGALGLMNIIGPNVQQGVVGAPEMGQPPEAMSEQQLAVAAIDRMVAIMDTPVQWRPDIMPR